jgi:NADPH-dependent curcumin reductase CurA
MVQPSDFELQTESIPSLQDGEALIKVAYVSFEPAQRGWMDDVPSYIPPIALGDVVRAG